MNPPIDRCDGPGKIGLPLSASHAFKSESVRSESGQRLAVASWSLQASNPDELVRRLVALDLHHVQLALDPLRDTPAIWGKTPTVLQQAGVGIVSGMFGCVGEDYATLQSIRQTGGLAPDSTWEQNIKNVEATAEIAAGLGLALVTYHAGFIPDHTNAAAEEKMRDRITRVAELFRRRHIQVALETGQETASQLASFMESLPPAARLVNFDPANMILYGQENPVAALKRLFPWIRQVHVKDAIQTQKPGTWGEEVPVGCGEVPWPEFFQTLQALGYAGDFVIEREAGDHCLEDVRAARSVVLKHAPVEC